MREIETIDELVAQREEAVLLRPRFAYFFVDAHLAGYFVRGRVVKEDAVEGVRLFRAVAHAGPTCFLADFSGIEDLEPAAAAVAANSIARRIARGDRLRINQAIVHPESVVGGTIAGFLSVFRPEQPFQTFADRASALRWLEREDASAAVERIARLIRERAALPGVVNALASLLEQDSASAWTLARAARSLGIAKRTLQLRLEEAGTSFREELARARLARAKTLLVRTDAKLLAVAIDVGFASAPHFSRWFRTHTGLSPSEFRAQKVQ